MEPTSITRAWSSLYLFWRDHPRSIRLDFVGTLTIHWLCGPLTFYWNFPSEILGLSRPLDVLVFEFSHGEKNDIIWLEKLLASINIVWPFQSHGYSSVLRCRKLSVGYVYLIDIITTERCWVIRWMFDHPEHYRRWLKHLKLQCLAFRCNMTDQLIQTWIKAAV